MDKNTPIENRLYFRCHDCLAMTCIELPKGADKHALTCGICGGRFQYVGHVESSSATWQHQVEVCDCNESCQSATGPKCTCRCGAVNHGVGWKSHIEIDAQGKVSVTPEANADKCKAQAEEYRVARSAARARIEARHAKALADIRAGRWVADYGAWQAATQDQNRLQDACKGKQHKSRMQKLARICAELNATA